MCCFYFAAFNICSLCLIFMNLINMYLEVFQLGFNLFGTLNSLDLGGLSLRLLCLGWPFCMLEVCGSSLLWRLLPMAGFGLLACQGFLDREACGGVLVGRAESLLSGVQ